MSNRLLTEITAVGRNHHCWPKSPTNLRCRHAHADGHTVPVAANSTSCLFRTLARSRFGRYPDSAARQTSSTFCGLVEHADGDVGEMERRAALHLPCNHDGYRQ